MGEPVAMLAIQHALLREPLGGPGRLGGLDPRFEDEADESPPDGAANQQEGNP